MRLILELIEQRIARSSPKKNAVVSVDTSINIARRVPLQTNANDAAVQGSTMSASRRRTAMQYLDDSAQDAHHDERRTLRHLG